MYSTSFTFSLLSNFKTSIVVFIGDNHYFLITFEQRLEISEHTHSRSRNKPVSESAQ